MSLLEPTRHRAEVVVPLSERRDRILATFESCAISIGEELIAAKAQHPGTFMRWVEDELPFGIDKAERLMAITRTFGTAGPELRRSMPSAYTALFELTRLPHERLQALVESGDVHPDMTVREARGLAAPEPVPLPDEMASPLAEPRVAAEVIARELMRFPRSQLSGDTANLLAAWLG